jgi:hypothetical protein
MDDDATFFSPSYSRPNRLSVELQETKRLLEERDRDAQLAAELGHALLQENNKLRDEIANLNDTIIQLEETVKRQQTAFGDSNNAVPKYVLKSHL